MSTRSDDVKEAAASAIKNKKNLEKHVADLAGSSRRERQSSAAVIAAVAKECPDKLVPHLADIMEPSRSADALGSAGRPH